MIAQTGEHRRRRVAPRDLLRGLLGLLWLLDGIVQLGSSHFDPLFFGMMLRMNMAEPPPWLWNLESVIEPFVTSHAVLANAFSGAIELAIGLGLLVRRTAQPALALSIPWAVTVWLFGESAGGLFGPGASALTGAPGASLLYAVVALVLWQDDSATGWRSELAATLADLAWVALWVGTAALESDALNRVASTPGSELSSAGLGEPAPLGALSHFFGNLVGNNGLEFAIVVAVVQAAVGLGILWRPVRRAALVGGIVVGLFYGVVGQDLGGILASGALGLVQSGATDPGTGPIIAILALALWPWRASAAAHAGEPAWGGAGSSSEPTDRRVEHGEHLRVTVSGRPMAELLPLASRPRSMAWSAFFRHSDRWRADPGLARELAELLPDTTDDLPIT